MSRADWFKRAAIAAALWRLFGAEPSPAFSPDQAHPAPYPGHSLFVGRREFFVRRVGAGEPLVLVHGWGDSSVVVWQRLAPLLAAQREVIMLDTRNHGRSSRHRGAYDIEDSAADVAAVLAELGLGPVDVFGYSMGGLVVQALAREHPELVDKIVLGGTMAGGLNRWQRGLVTAAFGVGRAIDRFSRAELSAARYWYLRHNGVVPDEHAAWLWDEQMARDPELYWQAGFAANRFDSSDWVADLDAPILLFVLADDQLVWPSRQRDLARRLTDATVVELSGARHEAPLTHAPEIAESVMEFLASTPSGPKRDPDAFDGVADAGATEFDTSGETAHRAPEHNTGGPATP
jgi:pimeloyl-ACP methyl ester carboxylesterase